MRKVIKFRAWDGDEMYFPDGEMRVDDGVIGSWKKGVVIMQYTGLLDKNGVEIYEGDILEDLTEEDFGYKMVIRWDDNFLGFKGFSRESKVVGNVFENKNLLKTVDEGVKEFFEN